MTQARFDVALVDEAAICLAVPLLLTVEPVRGRDGICRIRAAYPEFPECEATAEALTVALDRLDDERRERTVTLLASGGQPPRPRPHIAALVAASRRDILRNVAEMTDFGADL